MRTPHVRTGFLPQAAYWPGSGTTPQLWFDPNSLPAGWNFQSTDPYFFSDNRRFWVDRELSSSSSFRVSIFSSIIPGEQDELFSDFVQPPYDQGDDMSVNFVAQSGDMVGFYYRRDGTLAYYFVGRHPLKSFSLAFAPRNGSKINSRGLALLHKYEAVSGAVGPLYLWDLARPDTYRLIGTARSPIPPPGQARAYLGLSTPQDDSDPLTIINDMEVLIENVEDGSPELSLQRYTAQSLLPTGSAWHNFRAVNVSDNARYIVGHADDDVNIRHAILLTRLDGLSLAVDANRDGEIKLASEDASDATSTTQPYRFWVNDDDDSGDTGGGDISLSATIGGVTRNCDDYRINGTRDLVDWFPVFLDIKDLVQRYIPSFVPGDGDVLYKLKQSDGALNMVFTRLTRAQALRYQMQDVGSVYGGGIPFNLLSALGDAQPVTVTASGINIFWEAPDLYSTILSNDGCVLLFEGTAPSVEPLVLTLQKPDGAVIAEIKLPLKIGPVENMFHYLNLRHLAPGGEIAESKRGPQWGTSSLSAAPDDPAQGVPNRKNLVVLHGYNWTGEQGRGWSAEMFKRLYWSGNTARVISVLWRGEDSQFTLPGGTTVAPDYHVNVGHALQTAPIFRGFLNSLAPTPTAVLAHSLGNMVVSFALTHERDPNNFDRVRAAPRPAHVFNYFALAAAVPLEAYDSADRTSESLDYMRHPNWVGYDERLRATDWHGLFAGTSDARKDLTWQSLLAGLDIGVNFHSSGEEVLANPIDRSVPIAEPLINAGLFSWVSQEKHRGLIPEESLGALAFRSRHGGWGFDPEWYISVLTPEGPKQVRRPQDEAREANVPTSALPERPFFRWFQDAETDGYYPNYNGARLRAPIGDSGADDEARKHVTRAKILAEAIPALSYATGRNPSKKFPIEFGRSQDLNNENAHAFIFRTGWPAERGTERDWKHGDFREVAYRFVNPLYHRIVELGALKP